MFDANANPAPSDVEQTRSDSVPQPATSGTTVRRAETPDRQVPTYLSETYNWAYLNPGNVRFLDNELVVAGILWGRHNRLRRAAFAEIKPGQNILQPATVYGDFAPALARHIGPEGRLQVLDVAPIQVARCRHKLRDLPQASVRLADAGEFSGKAYDAVCCYFLLHELPPAIKHRVVDTLLASVVPGGRVVFVDYHRPHFAHPLRPIMSVVFNALEP
ncbi:MAG: rhodoquinone biosynthesis methyltransferase RquA, partial [Alphaproteobacteria bacterium]